MEQKNVIVNFSNFTFSFVAFQDQYKTLCETIATEKKYLLHRNVTKIRSFLFEYLVFVKTKDMRDMFINYVENINIKLIEDEEFESLAKRQDKSKKNRIVFYRKYYMYIIDIFRFVGSFGDELSKTFMPNKTDREKYFKYWNNNAFFEKFTAYKSKASHKLSSFTLSSFNETFIYFLGFYFAYYLFIDEESRVLCENLISNMLNLVLTNEVLNLMLCDKKDMTHAKHKRIKEIQNDLHKGFSSLFFRCNYSYSQYNVLPMMENKVLVDRTII